MNRIKGHGTTGNLIRITATEADPCVANTAHEFARQGLLEQKREGLKETMAATVNNAVSRNAGLQLLDAGEFHANGKLHSIVCVLHDEDFLPGSENMLWSGGWASVAWLQISYSNFRSVIILNFASPD
ncbi:hypothetical protein ON010_g16237 [Phytophthora cinnamomi]|nr:hypothetical protein ON010_g16237 [Phytophthora cinnamomi]